MSYCTVKSCLYSEKDKHPKQFHHAVCSSTDNYTVVHTSWSRGIRLIIYQFARMVYTNILRILKDAFNCRIAATLQQIYEKQLFNTSSSSLTCIMPNNASVGVMILIITILYNRFAWNTYCIHVIFQCFGMTSELQDKPVMHSSIA